MTARKQYPYLFIRVRGLENLGVCAVRERSEDRILITPNVRPVDLDAYEVNPGVNPLWIHADQAYGVRWTDNYGA